jgi:hypothetical protein
MILARFSVHNVRACLMAAIPALEHAPRSWRVVVLSDGTAPQLRTWPELGRPDLGAAAPAAVATAIAMATLARSIEWYRIVTRDKSQDH